MISTILLFLQGITLQTSKEFLDGTRTSLGSEFTSGLGSQIGNIIGIMIFVGLLVGFIIVMKGLASKYGYPEGRRIGRVRFTNLDGTEFFALVTVNETFVKSDVKQLADAGIIKTAPEVIERLERENNFKTYNAKIIKYGVGVRWRSKNRYIQIQTRASIENPDFFSNAQRGVRTWSSMLEPELTKIVFIHSCSTIEQFKTYNGKMKQVHSMAVMPTNPNVKYAQYSNIFTDRHITIPMQIDALEPELSEKLGSIIEWTPKVASLEKEVRTKDSTLKHFDEIIDDKSKKVSRFNIVINKMRGALEQKKLTGNEVKRDPLKMGSNIMLGVGTTFVGGMAYSAWLGIMELREYSPWFGVIMACGIIAILIHANEKRKKEEYARMDMDIE